MRTLTLFLIGLLLLAGCQTESQSTGGTAVQETPANNQPEESNVYQPGTPFTLAVGQSAIIGETGIGITFEMVERDGRCPSAVLCSESGPVVVIISAVQGDEQPTTFTMNPDPQLAQLSGMPPNIVTYQGFEIELTAVTPYPVQPEDILNMDYFVDLVVRESG